MQQIHHKNPGLTLCQRFFIEKSLELLYLGSIDSYRVRLNNPKSVLIELRYCLQQFQEGRIKHFHTIKAKDKEKKALADEVLLLLDYQPSYLQYNSISEKYIRQLLVHCSEDNYKRVVAAVDIMLQQNQSYLTAVIDGVHTLIAANQSTLADLEKLDTSLNILFTELISTGFSKNFLYRLIFGTFVTYLGTTENFDVHFVSFRTRVLRPQSAYTVVFRLDTTDKVYDSITAIHNPNIALSNEVTGLLLTGSRAIELEAFNRPAHNRKFIYCTISATDPLASLKKARSLFSEYLDVINLGLADEFIQIHHRALVIDTQNPNLAAFQTNGNILDGKYRVEKNHYLEFTSKLPAILNNTSIPQETKEKVKSAIRYLRLGNQSTEVEHKFINYWVGLEFLFSNYESQSTINRIKDHFITAHALAYVKRNAYDLKRSFSRISLQLKQLVPSYTPNDFSCLANEAFYTESTVNLLNDCPLLAYRAMKLHQWFFHPGRPANATEYLKKHKTNLEIHFTRIYRLRNEIIHDAATDTNNEHIASNLRYYLTFILNELIDYLSNHTSPSKSIEEYFILNEIELGNIEQNGYPLTNLLNVDCSIDFIS